MSVDLTGYTKVFTDSFDSDLSVYDGQSGLWSTGTRRDALQTNSNKSVFLDGTQVSTGGETVAVTPLSTEEGVLSIGSGVLSAEDKAIVQELLHQTGEDAGAETVNYYSSLIATDDTWGQTYGYYEAEIQVPEGQGHWSAFWLKPAGEGWPPETTFEMYGRGLEGQRTSRDNSFTTAVIFNETNLADPSQTNDVTIDNFYVRVDENSNILYNPDGSFDTVNGAPQEVMPKADGTYRFVSHNVTTDGRSFELDNNRVKQHLGLTENGDGTSIYDTFWTYGIQWTPDTITFWLGPDRDNMQIVYQTPTTDDHHVDMTMILNDQIGTTGGWWDPVLDENGNPQEGMFGPDNAMKVKSVSVYMMDPEHSLTGSGNGGLLVDGDQKTTITGTAGNDWVITGQGDDVIHLMGGADTVQATRGKDNKIIHGFGTDDVLLLEGYNIENAQDALARLTQVGDDVWLSNGAYPTDPQTILFRDMQVSDFSEDNFLVRWSETPHIWVSHLRDGSFQNELSSDGFQYARQGWVDLNGDGEIQNDPAAPGYERTGVGTRFFLARDSNGMVGSLDGDTYYGVKTGTTIIEQENGGIDTVFVARSFELSDHIENLTSTRSNPLATDEVLHFTGNGLDNRLTGAEVSEVFEGAGGDDLIDLSQGGADRLILGWGEGHDVVTGFGVDDLVEIRDFMFEDWADLQSHMSNWAGGVRIDLSNTASLFLQDLNIEDLNSDQFLFEQGESTTGFPDGERPDPSPDADSPTAAGEGYFKNLITTLSDTGDEAAKEAALDRSDTFVLGGDGDDALYGAEGRDKLFGGAGADVFLLRPAHEKLDVIKDFNLAEGDKIAIESSPAEMEILLRQNDNAVKIVAKDAEGLHGLGVVQNATVEDVEQSLILGWDLA